MIDDAYEMINGFLRNNLGDDDYAEFSAALYSVAAAGAAPTYPPTLEEYDAGLLNDFGGGNVEWWQDYIRAELSRAYEHYQSQLPEAAGAAPVPEPEGWQPIETAPKDGVELIGWRKDCGAILIRWTSCSELMTEPEIEQSGIDDATLFSEDWFCAGERLEGCEIPTHWMSLPASPKDPT